MAAGQRSLEAERMDGEDQVKEGFKTTTLASFIWYSVCNPLAFLCSIPEEDQDLEAH